MQIIQNVPINKRYLNKSLYGKINRKIIKNKNICFYEFNRLDISKGPLTMQSVDFNVIKYIFLQIIKIYYVNIYTAFNTCIFSSCLGAIQVQIIAPTSNVVKLMVPYYSGIKRVNNRFYPNLINGVIIV